MAGYIINFVISALAGLAIALFGVHACRSETPAVMNTGEKPLRPEQLRDVKAWNTKHGKAFILLGIAVTLTSAVFPLVLEHVDAALATVIYIAVTVLEITGVLAYHRRLERLYRIK